MRNKQGGEGRLLECFFKTFCKQDLLY